MLRLLSSSSSTSDLFTRISTELSESKTIFGVNVFIFVAVFVIGAMLVGLAAAKIASTGARIAAAVALGILFIVFGSKISLPAEIEDIRAGAADAVNQVSPIDLPGEDTTTPSTPSSNTAGYELRAFQGVISPEEALTTMASMPTFTYKNSCTSNYEREEWKHWSDFDRDGINTRHEELMSESLTDVTMTSSGRSVATGLWDLVYTKGTSTSPSDLDAEHSTPLGLAHCIVDSMGLSLDEDTREEFANDPTLTFMAEKGENRARGAKSWADSPWGDGWFPSNSDVHCPWIAVQIQLRSEYGMGVTDSERSIAQSVLEGCVE